MIDLNSLVIKLVPAFAKGTGAASLVIRVGLAFTFTYAAVSAFQSPNAWISYVPSFIGDIMSAKLALDLISVVQLVLAIWLLTGVYVSLAAIVSIGFLAGIVITNPGTFLVTFRDVGLVAASLALISLDASASSKTKNPKTKSIKNR